MDLSEIKSRRDGLVQLDVQVMKGVTQGTNLVKLFKVYEALAILHYEDDLTWAIQRIEALEGMVKKLTTEFMLTHEQLESAMCCEDPALEVKEELPLLREMDEKVIQEAEALVKAGATEDK